jgi:hypothetical protein
MKPYSKINNLWKRNPDNLKTLIEGHWTLDVFRALHKADWLWYEKIDGTNVRITFKPDFNYAALPFNKAEVVFCGRRDLTNADGSYKPPHFSGNLWNHVRPLYTVEWFKEHFDLSMSQDAPITLYGEGFGAGIQKGGGYGEAAFCLFDIKIGDTWMEQEFVTELAAQAGIQRAPVRGIGPLTSAIDMTRKGFDSAWGEFQAEGLIVRPLVELSYKWGRVMGKIKTKDFPNG